MLRRGSAVPRRAGRGGAGLGSLSQDETERQLRWLMALRVVVVTTLLLSALVIELLFRPAESLRPLFLLAAAAYGMALLYALLDHWLKGTPAFTFLQLVGDALVVTLFVHITGGLDSPMSFLYLLPISVAALMLYRTGALAMAGVCFALYAGLIAPGGGSLPFGAAGASAFAHEPSRVVYFLVAHLVALGAVAFLAVSLTERLRAQGHELADRRRAVARLQALNENIIESIHSGLITTDLEGRVNFINRGGTEITGLTQADVENGSIEALLGLEPGFLQDARQRLRAERRFRFERYYDARGGRRIFLGVAVSNLYDRAGRPLGHIFIFQDLTEIQALEQEVRLKERMAALGEMAAGLAHELRNPLAAISGAVQYLKGDLKPQGEVLELMDIILKESQRLDQAIRDFLTFARPGDFAPETSDLVKLIEDNLKLLRKSREFRESHRLVTRYAASRMDCQVDPNRLKQVFWNLATNALKAMPEGGELAIAVDWTETGDHVEISFADQGIGMDEGQLERYFQPFSSSFAEGTGLGAAIVYRLVHEHGGRIQLESGRARGTRVRIQLPSRQELPAPQAPAPLRRIAGGG